MPNEKDKKKSVSMKKAARTYMKTRTKAKTEHMGSHFFDENAKPYSIGTSERRLKYKPKARAATFGGVDKGEGVTKRVRRARSK